MCELFQTKIIIYEFKVCKVPLLIQIILLCDLDE